MAPRGKSVTLSVLIAGDAKGGVAAMRQARGEARTLSADMERLATSAATAFAVYRGYDALQGSAEAAAALVEQQGKVRDVYAESAAEVNRWAEGNAKAIGLSTRASLDYAGTLGNLLQAMGLAEDQAADWSMGLVNLAADMAAFNDVPIEDTLLALRSGLSGEMEPLKKFGVNLADARLRTEALNQGIYDGTGILDANQKAQAAYALILKDTSRQVGAVQREYDGLGQAQKRAAAEAENARATFGEGLIPIFTAQKVALAGLASAYSSLPAPIQATISIGAAATVGVAALGFATATLVPIVKTGAASLTAGAAAARAYGLSMIVPTSAVTGLGAAQSATTAKTVGLTAALRTQTTAVGPLGKGLVALAVGWAAFETSTRWLEGQTRFDGSLPKLQADLVALAEGTRTADQAVREIAASTDVLAAKFDRAFDSSTVWERLRSIPGGLAPGSDLMAIRQAESDINALDDALAGLVESGNAEAAQRAYGVLAAELIAQGVETEKVARFLPKYWDAVDQAGEANAGAAGEIDETAQALTRQRSALERATAAVERHRDRVQAEFDASRAARDASEARREAVADLAAAQRAAVGDSDEYRDATEAVTDAKKAEVEASRGVIDAQAQVRDAQQELNVARAEAVDRLRDMAQAAREAATAESGAEIALREARKEQERVNASNATNLQKDAAAQKVREAEDALAAARLDNAQAQKENTSAALAGVEGDREVVAAKGRVQDALNAVSDAERRVRDAQEETAKAGRRQAKILEDAKGQVRAAAKRVEDAIYDEGKAWADLVTIQDGAVAGVKAYREVLRELAADLAPGSELRRNLEGLIAELAPMAIVGGSIPSPDALAQRPAAELDALGQILGGGRGLGLSITNNIQGTTRQQNRKIADGTRSSLEDLLIGGRGAGGVGGP